MTSISAERNGLAAVGMRLRRREEWGARRSYGPDSRYDVSEPATRVFVHITITNPENYSSRDAHARAVEAIGISRFPNTGISYNRLIFAGTDTVYEAQPIGRRGAHTVNDHQRSTCTRWGSACPGYKASLTAPDWNLNFNSRAYVICQNTQHTVTDQMVTAIARAIVADARAGFVTEYAAQRPHGHRCVSSKSCPGDKMWAKMGSLETKVAAFLANPASIGGGSGGVTIPPPPDGDGFDPEEDDMFTDTDRAMLERLVSVITSYSDEKIDRPDTDTGTAGMRYALQEAWHDTHGLMSPIPFQSPAAEKYVRDVIEWKDATDPTKARQLSTRYMTEIMLTIAHRMEQATKAALEAQAATMAQVLGGDPGNDLTEDQWRTILRSEIEQVFDNISLDLSVDQPQESPTP